MAENNLMSQTNFWDPLRSLPVALTRLYTWWVRSTYRFASAGQNLSIHYQSKVPKSRASRIALGNSVVISKDAWVNISSPAENDQPVLIIEDGCFIAPRTELSAKNCIHLERDVMLSPQVLIMDHSHAYEDITLPIKEQGVSEGGTIRIGEGSWIGHGAAIVCGRGSLTLGRNCVVAANSLVTRSFPDYSVIAGNPARVVKQYDVQKKQWVLGSAAASAKVSSQSSSSEEEVLSAK
jgi:acetyltransferase-like isoleucine patch superfamily enzyme